MTKPTFPLQSCRSRFNSVVIFLKGLFFCIRERQLWRGTRVLKIRYVNGSSGAVTSVSSPCVHRHIHIFTYIYVYILHTYMYIYINIYSIDESTASQLDFLLNYIYICVCVEQNYLNFSCNNTFIVEIQRQTGRGNKKMK